ncbi:MAG: baseplate J/gp47 family protein [Chloroflexota bacterium]|nr:baseplate J/gp47 family protein [Chloroflexota bacterium]
MSDDFQTASPQSGQASLQPALSVVEVPEDISAAAVRQVLLQHAGSRIALVFRSNPGANDAAAGVTRGWAQIQREGRPSDEAGLVLFQVLRRQADAQGSQVAIVTRNERLRTQANDAGLPVFSTVDGAQDHSWNMGRSHLDYTPPGPSRNQRDTISSQRRAWLPSRFRRVEVSQGRPGSTSPLLEVFALAAVLFLSVAAVSALLAFVVPLASVKLVPAQEPIAHRISLVARTDAETAEYGKLLIPARRIGQRVEGDGTIEATGNRSAPDQPAVGQVVFTNRSSQPQEIPAGTVVATSTGANVRFETLEPALLEGGSGARVPVAVQALEPGSAGNVRAFSVNTVEGPMALSLNVINPANMAGGTVKQVAVVTQADKDRLRSQVLQRVTQEAYVALGDLLDEGEFVPPDTVGSLVVAETYDRFTDEEADQVSLRLRLLATGIAVDGASAEEFALRALGDEIPRRGRLLSESIGFTRGSETVSFDGEDNAEIAFDMTASGVAVIDIDPAAVRATIRGLPEGEAVGQLQQNWRLQSPPELTLGPEWVLPVLRELDFNWLPVQVADRVPWLPFRTQVRVEFIG